MANNPYVNKVVYGDDTLIDLTDTTAEAGDVAEGKYFYNAAGSRTLGTASASVVDTAMSDTSENAVQNKVIKAYVDSMILTSTDDDAGTVTLSVSPSSLLNADTTGY